MNNDRFDAILNALGEATRTLNWARFAALNARWENTPENAEAAKNGWAAVRAAADRLEALADTLDPERAEDDEVEFWAHFNLTTKAEELRAAAENPA